MTKSPDIEQVCNRLVNVEQQVQHITQLLDTQAKSQISLSRCAQSPISQPFAQALLVLCNLICYFKQPLVGLLVVKAILYLGVNGKRLLSSAGFYIVVFALLCVYYRVQYAAL